MKVIDLTKPMYSGMEVYPGDPEVEIKQIHFLKKQGWILRKLTMGSHTGTHVDAFSHMDPVGKTLDEINLDKFVGEAIIYNPLDKIILREPCPCFIKEDINALLPDIIKVNPKFVVIGDECNMTPETEAELLKNRILTFTGLVDLEKLPKGRSFLFVGAPLKIADGDGSPIRAFAMVD